MTEKVSVRIAVAVDETGRWGSIGFSNMRETDAIMSADNLEGRQTAWFWLTAALPCPETPEVVTVEAAAEPIKVEDYE